MEDDNKTNKYIKFFTNSFSLQNVFLLQYALLNKLEIY